MEVPLSTPGSNRSCVARCNGPALASGMRAVSAHIPHHLQTDTAWHGSGVAVKREEENIVSEKILLAWLAWPGVRDEVVISPGLDNAPKHRKDHDF